MGLFRKRADVDVLDYTLFQKKGLLEKAKQTAGKDSGTPNPLGFFDFGGVNSQQPELSSPAQSDFTALKNKIEDLEYKFERLVERLERIDSKMGER